MSFWVISGIIGGLAAMVLALAMNRTRNAGNDTGFDVRVYKDQLTEVDRDLDRQVMSKEEAERSRIEISRRLLEADKTARDSTGSAVTRVGVVISGVLAVTVFGAAFVLYTSLGAPNYPDWPLAARIEMSDAARADRPRQTDAETGLGVVGIDPNADPRHLELMEKLRVALETRPDDLQGHVLLAHNEAELGNFVAAHQAQARVLAIKAHAVQAGDYQGGCS
jgi:cytochrome c-type biogenesis protein CcmH